MEGGQVKFSAYIYLDEDEWILFVDYPDKFSCGFLLSYYVLEIILLLVFESRVIHNKPELK